MTVRTEEEIRLLYEIAKRHGVQVAYQDGMGRQRKVSVESLVVILNSLGVSVAPDLRGIRDTYRRTILSLLREGVEPVTVCWAGESHAIRIRLPKRDADRRCDVELTCESGNQHSWVQELSTATGAHRLVFEGSEFIEKRIKIRYHVPMGYHRYRVSVGRTEWEGTLICAPPDVYAAMADRGTARTWGLFVPTYALHSRDAIGVGDFGEVEKLLEWARGLGGCVLGTLPFFSSFLLGPLADNSPYRPVSRLFWNELFVDLRKTAEWDRCALAREQYQSAGFQADLAKIQAERLVDYGKAAELKTGLLRQMSDYFFSAGGDESDAFRYFLRDNPRTLDYATFMAVCEKRGAPFQEWPAELYEGKITADDYDIGSQQYHSYAQFVAWEQLRDLSKQAKRVGPGLYLDMPLGVHPSGYDMWREGNTFLRNVSVGAPPDPAFGNGQNWGFLPFHPVTIRKTGYQYYRDCVRKLMSCSGLIRIDHIMGLHRLFCIPDGMPSSEGVYLRYPSDDYYAILALESHRNQCLVAGEDLGTVPYMVRQKMAKHGILRLFVLAYEVNPRSMEAIRAVPTHCVASLNTHDMAPFHAFMTGHDVDRKVTLGLASESDAVSEKEWRLAVRQRLAEFLSRQGLYSGADNDLDALLKASLTYLAKSPARILLIDLENLWGELDPQNIPGTTHQYPNWRRKAKFSVDELRKQVELENFLKEFSTLR